MSFGRLVDPTPSQKPYENWDSRLHRVAEVRGFLRQRGVGLGLVDCLGSFLPVADLISMLKGREKMREDSGQFAHLFRQDLSRKRESRGPATSRVGPQRSRRQLSCYHSACPHCCTWPGPALLFNSCQRYCHGSAGMPNVT